MTAAKLSRADLKSYQKLLQKKFRQEEGKFLVEGLRSVEEALASEWVVEAVIATAAFLENRKIKGRSGASGAHHGEKWAEGSARDLEQLSDAETPQGIVAVVHRQEPLMDALWKSSSTTSIVVALDNVSDPGNAGTIIRTCDWFGVDAVLLDERSVELYNPKVVRSTMGSMFHLPVGNHVELPEAMRQAKRNGFTVYATGLSGGEPLSKGMIAKKSLIVFGNESHGISSEVEKLAERTITIPGFGKAESLNVATSCAVVLATVRLF
ncbi:MAG TPA: RNA methyltransferase [Bacteroidota bacterium]|jgi:TrmH family RNA methyltransferase|nr:RNA methyltransferase [Bacteroidota bacterium]